MSLLCTKSLPHQLAKQVIRKPCVLCVVQSRTFFWKEHAVGTGWHTKLTKPYDLTINGVLKWLSEKDWKHLVDHHRFNPDRLSALGPDIAAAHFILKRRGAIKFKGYEWIESYSKEDQLKVPGKFVPGMLIEAIDASSTDMMHLSFDNIKSLTEIQFLSLRNCIYIDDWCLDRLSHFADTLVVLDLSGCPLITERGLASLHRLNNLKRLILEDMPNVRHKTLTAVMLEEAMPGVVIEGIDFADTQKEDVTHTPGFISNAPTEPKADSIIRDYL